MVTWEDLDDTDEEEANLDLMSLTSSAAESEVDS